MYFWKWAKIKKIEMYSIYLIISALLYLGACKGREESANVNPEANLTKTQKYFLKVALGAEFGTSSNRIAKWNEEIKVYVPDSSRTDLVDELKSILKELNNFSPHLKISRVMEENEANFLVFFSGRVTYGDYEPNAKPSLEDNWGLVWIYWNNNSNIYKGSLYVDVERNTEINCMKHLLREELTQGLGLLNDTNDYPASIFYQQWTCSPSYAEIDKELIQLLYHPKIKAGMSKREVIKVLESL